ncbi:hypothetical protein FXO38_24444 [Capsicum annuum]|uniref:RNA helicase n=1 Tax=Capsicum annuum TaxID=4072 RepID=A0A2G2YRF9_CAPAN|nr:hypothetical protein FXO38_24444 [Capsicum annuum]KAF3684623.1 hypothetical protein FXO37_01266 [Capsicum annuum]PHT72336.1 hypothetical protein T459_23121 [Capsicum annuum]
MASDRETATTTYTPMEPNVDAECSSMSRKRKFRRRVDDHEDVEDVVRNGENERQKLSRREEQEAIRRSDDIGNLRKISRREYLKKREKKILDALRDEIVDEQYFFERVKLTEAEQRELKHKQKIYELVKKSEDTDDIGEYRMPDAYDHEGGVNQKTRYSVALQRDRDTTGKTKPISEQEAWEDHQIAKGTVKFGSKYSKQRSEDYQFVLEDQIEFIKASVIDGVKFDQEPGIESIEKFTAKSAFEKLRQDRKTLPIYSYKDDLLQAINDHQVLVIVGETGSGKTTQRPQYLHEAGYTKRGKIGCTQPR